MSVQHSLLIANVETRTGIVNSSKFSHTITSPLPQDLLQGTERARLVLWYTVLNTRISQQLRMSYYNNTERAAPVGATDRVTNEKKKPSLQTQGGEANPIAPAGAVATAPAVATQLVPGLPAQTDGNPTKRELQMLDLLHRSQVLLQRMQRFFPTRNATNGSANDTCYTSRYIRYSTR